MGKGNVLLRMRHEVSLTRRVTGDGHCRGYVVFRFAFEADTRKTESCTP